MLPIFLLKCSANGRTCIDGACLFNIKHQCLCSPTIVFIVWHSERTKRIAKLGWAPQITATNLETTILASNARCSGNDACDYDDRADCGWFVRITDNASVFRSIRLRAFLLFACVPCVWLPVVAIVIAGMAARNWVKYYLEFSVFVCRTPTAMARFFACFGCCWLVFGVWCLAVLELAVHCAGDGCFAMMDNYSGCQHIKGSW